MRKKRSRERGRDRKKRKRKSSKIKKSLVDLGIVGGSALAGAVYLSNRKGTKQAKTKQFDFLDSLANKEINSAYITNQSLFKDSLQVNSLRKRFSKQRAEKLLRGYENRFEREKLEILGTNNKNKKDFSRNIALMGGALGALSGAGLVDIKNAYVSRKNKKDEKG